MANTPSAGPAYKNGALKYKDDPEAAERLAQKILAGGAGVWGQILMPPHPLHSIERIRQTVSWVLALKNDPASPPKTGLRGAFTELRSGSPTGSLLAILEVKPTGEGEFLELPATLANATGLTDVCVVAHCPDPATVLGLNWIEFQP